MDATLTEILCSCSVGFLKKDKADSVWQVNVELQVINWMDMKEVIYYQINLLRTAH